MAAIACYRLPGRGTENGVQDHRAHLFDTRSGDILITANPRHSWIPKEGEVFFRCFLLLFLNATATAESEPRKHHVSRHSLHDHRQSAALPNTVMAIPGTAVSHDPSRVFLGPG